VVKAGPLADRWLITVLMIASAYPVIHWLDWFADDRRWLPFLTGGTALVSGVLHVLHQANRRDRREGSVLAADEYHPLTGSLNINPRSDRTTH
jgi:hypothetical protein